MICQKKTCRTLKPSLLPLLWQRSGRQSCHRKERAANSPQGCAVRHLPLPLSCSRCDARAGLANVFWALATLETPFEAAQCRRRWLLEKRLLSSLSLGGWHLSASTRCSSTSPRPSAHVAGRSLEGGPSFVWINETGPCHRVWRTSPGPWWR